MHRTQHYLEERKSWPLETQQPLQVTELPMHLSKILPIKPFRTIYHHPRGVCWLLILLTKAVKGYKLHLLLFALRCKDIKKNVRPSGFSRDARSSKFWLCKLSVEWPHGLPFNRRHSSSKTISFYGFYLSTLRSWGKNFFKLKRERVLLENLQLCS